MVWVTGASSGIGRALALRLAADGVKLVLSARRARELEQVKTECLAASNGALATNDVLVLQMDILLVKQHPQFLQAVLERFSRVDILVNNAGRSQRADWLDIDLQVDHDLFDLDVFAVVNLTRLVVNYFKTAAIAGHVAVTSSTAGLLAIPNSASYVGAKHAIHGYFGALRVEQPHIGVTIFCPGPTFSDFLRVAFTGRPGVEFGQPVKVTDSRMTAQRCAELYAIALANRTHVSFVACFPIPLLVQVTRHFPNAKDLLLPFFGSRTMNRLRDSTE